MWNFLVEINYQDLADYLLNHAEQDLPKDDAVQSFAFAHQFLSKKVKQFMDYDYRVDGSDQELLDILMRHHTYGTIKDIKISRSPGIVVKVNDCHAVMPLVLIDLQF